MKPSSLSSWDEDEVGGGGSDGAQSDGVRLGRTSSPVLVVFVVRQLKILLKRERERERERGRQRNGPTLAHRALGVVADAGAGQFRFGPTFNRRLGATSRCSRPLSISNRRPAIQSNQNQKNNNNNNKNNNKRCRLQVGSEVAGRPNNKRTRAKVGPKKKRISLDSIKTIINFRNRIPPLHNANVWWCGAVSISGPLDRSDFLSETRIGATRRLKQKKNISSNQNRRHPRKKNPVHVKKKTKRVSFDEFRSRYYSILPSMVERV